MTGEGVACRPCPAVIASAAKQSILSLRGKMECFAALAMTARAMDCFAEPVIGRAFARLFAGDDGGGCGVPPLTLRHCERSEAIHLAAQRKNGLLRGACHRARIRAPVRGR